MKLNITLRGSDGLYEKQILGVTRIKQLFVAGVEIYKADELIMYGPEEYDEYEVIDTDAQPAD